jgi:hypothetical protein
MTTQSAIRSALQRSASLCDDCLSEVTGIRPRQAINIAARKLAAQKDLSRTTEACARCRRSKIVNRMRSGTTVAVEVPRGAGRVPPMPIPVGGRPWYWEGNVQRKIVEFLVARRYQVLSEADTASRQQGKDIVARSPDGRTLWVSVKGFPEKSKNTQARHWFAGALHDMARYRDEDGAAILAMGLPSGFKTYEGLLQRNKSVRQFLGYGVFWVQPDGTVSNEGLAR